MQAREAWPHGPPRVAPHTQHCGVRTCSASGSRFQQADAQDEINDQLLVSGFKLHISIAVPS